jgi:hypothetical protein
MNGSGIPNLHIKAMDNNPFQNIPYKPYITSHDACGGRRLYTVQRQATQRLRDNQTKVGLTF